MIDIDVEMDGETKTYTVGGRGYAVTPQAPTYETAWDWAWYRQPPRLVPGESSAQELGPDRQRLAHQRPRAASVRTLGSRPLTVPLYLKRRTLLRMPSPALSTLGPAPVGNGPSHGSRESRRMACSVATASKTGCWSEVSRPPAADSLRHFARRGSFRHPAELGPTGLSLCDRWRAVLA